MMITVIIVINSMSTKIINSEIINLISTDIIDSKIIHVFSKLKKVFNSCVFLSSIVIEGFATLSFLKIN